MNPRFSAIVLFLTLTWAVNLWGQTPMGTLAITARSVDSGPIPQLEVQAGTTTSITDERGNATLQLAPGEIEVHLQRVGFKPKDVRATIIDGQITRMTVDLEPVSVIEESVVVNATRADTLLEDEPLRVEILRTEELEEKSAMSPGDISMLLNETSGVRVQVTSPALGAGNVRIQGLLGRYTEILSDGLPLYGQVGSIGIMQIPPLDLGQVEVIKGVASALYGSSALGGVINLVSRRPGKETERQFLFNTTSRKGEDAVFWYSEPQKKGWSYSLLTGAHFQQRSDIDKDHWADLPEYQRGVLRPRVYWDNGKGASLFLTSGFTAEDRAGGSSDFPEELRTRRADTGIVGRFVHGNKLLSVRGSAMTQWHRRVFGSTLERERQTTLFEETSVSGTHSDHSWTVGSAIQADLYRPKDFTTFRYSYVVPALFLQDEYKWSSRLTLSGSGRVDFHSKYGTFFSPRVSALIRLHKDLTARVSSGTGVFAPTPFTEETEATGLSRLMPLGELKAERAWSSSTDLSWKHSWLELSATAFASRIKHAIGLTRDMEIVNSSGPTRTMGSELFAKIGSGDFSLVLTHTFVHSTEFDVKDLKRQYVPLTPKHTAGFDFFWEQEKRMRIGIEGYYTGRQSLEDNPYRKRSIPFWVFGILIERHIGAASLFVNAEDLGDFRQTRHDPLVRPTPDFDGRRTVDAWGPIEGRVINGGIRFGF